ncbi:MULTISPECIES: Hsp70 family protein [unclassified Rhodococcus (in: high G+C Gram-positive bacteria)]|uniref:Hsp70 family protein n=1 Tax=unclassified Rhodococcus (in: high G+C Gram-positive bacteria) TaxID=192944 RepID=UPI0020CCA949|nr:MULTISPECIES: Hsp70 family protein [unclassified Rhodococcus (in: high G+C Gram-positive bacteria)]
MTAVVLTAVRDEGGDTTMNAGLGIRIGSVTAVAALDTEPVTSVVKRSALDLRPGEAPRLAELWDRSTRNLISGFADRVGDPVELIDDDGRSHRAEDLYATAARALVAEVSAGTDAAPTVVVTHPTRWTAYTAEVLGEALERAGLTDVTLVPESVATMRWLEVTRGPQADGLAVVYDLGATALDVTLMRTGSEAGTVGTGVHSEEFGGAQFDHAIMQYVLDTVSGSQSFEFDPFDPDTVGALVELRARCGEAKEQLSYDTSTSLTVDLPGLHTEVRLVRSEVEELVRASLLASIGVVRDAVTAAGLDVSDIDQVVLVGGSSAIPLVAELMSSELRAPVVAGPRPELTVAVGAAILGSDIADATASDNAAALAAAPTTAVASAAAAAPMPRPTPRPAPTPTAVDSDAGMSGRKKAGVVAGSVLVLALLAGGGLSVGTALTSDNTTPAESNAETSISSTETPGTSAAVADAATTTPATGENGVAAPGSEGAPTTVVNADGTVTQIDPATGAPVAGSPAPADNGAATVPTIPSVAAPTVPNYQPPAVQVPQAPSVQVPSYQGPTLGDVGQGVGDGLGGVVGGVGDGLGGVVGGVGDGLGGALGGLTGR